MQVYSYFEGAPAVVVAGTLNNDARSVSEHRRCHTVVQTLHRFARTLLKLGASAILVRVFAGSRWQ